jgi:ribosomal protein S18 acetylase RimI-like enzyme
MRVVIANDRHIDAAWDVMRRCKAALTARGIHQWDDVYPARDVIAADVARGALFVLEDEHGRCVGSVALDETQSEEYQSLTWTSPEPALVVHRLCVDPAEQGKGLARRLMDFAESLAVERGYASIRLDAYTGNPRSVQLYRRRGYREVGQVFFPRRALPFWCFELPLDRPRVRE